MVPDIMLLKIAGPPNLLLLDILSGGHCINLVLLVVKAEITSQSISLVKVRGKFMA